MTDEEFLCKIGFKHIATLEGSKTTYMEDCPDSPLVYAHIFDDGRAFNIGESKTRKRPFDYGVWLENQYENSNERTRELERNRQARWHSMSKGQRLRIFVRTSDKRVVWGQEVSLHKVEEEALHERLKPVWNMRKPARVKKL